MSLRKDYFASISQGELIISSNPNNTSTDWDTINDITKRYLYKEGDKIVTPFGIETIKNIDKNYGEHYGYEWLITVKENGNQYKPCELIGIYVKTIKYTNIKFKVMEDYGNTVIIRDSTVKFKECLDIIPDELICTDDDMAIMPKEPQVDWEMLNATQLLLPHFKKQLLGKGFNFSEELDNLQLFFKLLSTKPTFAKKAYEELNKLNQ
jgi:hypothetical protein